MRVVVMGVTGSGKSSVGALLAAQWGHEFADGDDFHPQANVAKMAAGTSLTDQDREPWLDAIAAWLADRDDAVVACSALKRSYRDRLRAGAAGIVVVHLAAPQGVLAERVALRSATTDHFAGVGLLDSQFASLEPLGFDEQGITLDVAHLSVTAAAASALDDLARFED